MRNTWGSMMSFYDQHHGWRNWQSVIVTGFSQNPYLCYVYLGVH